MATLYDEAAEIVSHIQEQRHGDTLPRNRRLYVNPEAGAMSHGGLPEGAAMTSILKTESDIKDGWTYSSFHDSLSTGDGKTIWLTCMETLDSRRGPCGLCPVEGGQAVAEYPQLADAKNCPRCEQIFTGINAVLRINKDVMSPLQLTLLIAGLQRVNVSTAKGGLQMWPTLDYMHPEESLNSVYELVHVPEIAPRLSQKIDHANVNVSGLLPLVTRPFLPPAPDSEEAWQWLRHKFQTCLQEHAGCAKLYPNTPTLPARLLDLSKDEDKIYLIDSDTTDPRPYACLSHCWGPQGVSPRTTKANIQQHKTGIPLTDLSKTFRDAVIIARRLSLQLLWIDSLCIIQDDSDDWDVQSQTMCDVYGNAALTLSAAASPNGNGGCLGPINPEHAGVRLPSAPDEPAVMIRKLINHALFLDSTDAKNNSSLYSELPLLSRAWAYQERVLSPRVIHFGPEMIWECHESTVCQCMSIEWPAQTWKNKNSVGENSASRKNTFAAKKWHGYVEHYTALRLTYEQDIYPALSGIARRYSQTYPQSGRYLAGLWECTMIQDLAWRPAANKGKLPLNESRAPSWSWASQAACVEFLFADDEFCAMCEYISADCTLKGSDLFGGVASGHVVLRGPLTPMTFKYSATTTDGGWKDESVPRPTDRAPTREEYNFFVKDQAVTVVSGMISFDHSDDEARMTWLPEGSEIHVLMLCHYGGHSFGLVLRKQDGNDTFTRIGSFHSIMHGVENPNDPVRSNAETRTITIV